MFGNSRRIFFLIALFAFLCTSVICGEAVEQKQQPSADSAGTHFYFAQLTDTHFGRGNNTARTAKVIDTINKLPFKLEFVVHTGDIFHDCMTNEKIRQTGLELLKQLKYPLMILPGNHDIRRKTAEEDAKLYTTAFGPLINVREINGVVFIAIFTEELAHGTKVKGFNPLQSLEKELEKANGKPVVVFHHAPCVEDLYQSKLHKGWPEKNRKAWIELLNRYNVKAVIAGHFHRDELHRLGNVPLFAAPPVAGFFGRQATCRLYEYNNGKISYSAQYD